jgi:quinol monooxygenase YgiN
LLQPQAYEKQRAGWLAQGSREPPMKAAGARMTATWTVRPSEVRSIAAVLQGLMAATRVESGCLSCSLATDLGAHAVIHYREEWASEWDLQRQLRSDRFPVLVELLERGDAAPAVEFDLAGVRRGLDYAAEIRQTPHE